VTNRLERLDPGTLLVTSWPGDRRGGGAATEPSGHPPSEAAAVAGGSPQRPEALEVLAARPHQGRFIVSFAGVVDRDGAEGLRGARLLAAPIEGDPDAWFVHELIGCELVDLAGRVLGTVTAVQANPASDLLVLDEGHLVPLRFVVRRSPGRLVADLPEGLIE
jgi:16S rRNA processing protein RimM